MKLPAIISLRPQEPDQASWAALATEYSMGFSHMPIMEEKALPLDDKQLATFQGFVVSSPAVARLHGTRLKELARGRPMHVVGKRSANILRELGCEIGLWGEDGNQLQEKLQGHSGDLCFLSGEDVRVDFKALPGNGVVSRIICYEMILLEWDAQSCANCFHDGNLLLVTSGRIAEALSQMGQKQKSKSVHAACLSLAIADRLALPLGHIIIAPDPNIETLFGVVRHFLSKRSMGA